MKTRFAIPLFLFALTTTLASCAADTPDEQIVSRYARAKDMYAQGRFPETSNLLSEIKNFVPALALRAKAEYFAGDLEKAETFCREVIKRRPSAFETKLYLARILAERGDTEQAEKVALDLLADNPQDIRTLRFAAELALSQGKTGSARELLDQAADLRAEIAMIFLDRARLHWTAGRGGEALADLDKAGILLPWDTPVARSVEQLQSVIKETLK